MFDNIKTVIGTKYLDEIKYEIKEESYYSVTERFVWQHVRTNLLLPLDILLLRLFDDK